MTGFGDRLRKYREARGWSQERVGFELEVTKATVSKWETGRAEPSLDNLVKIRRLYAPYGATLDQLIDDGFAVAEPLWVGEASAAPSPRVARSSEEMALLMRFRGLAAPRQRGLLELLAD